MSTPILRLRDVRMQYAANRGPATVAIDGVSLDLHRKETLGIVGESGCGKSTLALTIMSILPENGEILGGSIEVDGLELVGRPEADLEAVRWQRIAMVFQGAMNALNPVQRIGTQLMEPMLRRGIKRRPVHEVRAHVIDLLRAVDLGPEVMQRYPHELSGGMKQRAIVAMSLVCSPDVIIADEPTTALDVVAQDRVLELLEQVRDRFGTAIILISHDIAVIIETCDTLAVMYAGQVVEAGPVKEVFASPRHPYTRSLLGSVPSVTGPKRPLVGIPGEPPDLRAPPVGCRFAPRCDVVMEACTDGLIEEALVSAGHRARCLRALEPRPPLHHIEYPGQLGEGH